MDSGGNGSALLTGALLLMAGLVIGLVLGVLLARRGRWSSADGPAAPDVAAVLAPAADALVRVEHQLAAVERERIGAYAGLQEQVAALHRASTELGGQARSLVGALRAPTVRGRWGEVQLQRLVELAGMVEHCDYDVQVSAPGGDGPGVRPDLLVRLSGGRSVPVDAKVPFHAWLEALDTSDEQRRRQLLLAHARAMRQHVDQLAGKAYWRHFHPAPEFVVLFVPGEPLLDAALSVDPGLADHAFARNVVLATPTSLIALLRTVAFSWRHERVSASAAEVLEVGRDLHGRLVTLSTHLSRTGTALQRAVGAYNQAVGSFETRVVASARRLSDLGVVGDELSAPPPIDTAARDHRWSSERFPSPMAPMGPSDGWPRPEDAPTWADGGATVER